MVNLGLPSIPFRPKCPKAFNGGSFVKPLEYTDGSIKFALSVLEAGTGLSAPVSSVSTSLFSTDFGQDSIRNDLFRDGGTDAHASVTVTNGRAPVNPVSGMIVRRNNHATVAGAAAKNAKSGKEPVRFGGSSTTHLDSLNSSPKVPVDDGFVCVKVDVLPEVNLTEIDPRGEKGTGSVVGPADAVFPKVLANIGDGGPVPPHFECFDNDGCLVVGDKDSVLAFAVARQLHIPSNDTPGYGIGLGGTEFLAGLSSVELVEGADKGALKPARSGFVRHVTEVHGCDPASGCFYAINDFVLNGDGSDESVEVGDGNNVGFPVFDGLNGGKQSGPVGEGQSSGCVEFFRESGDLEAFFSGPFSDAVRLVAGRHESFSGSSVDFGYADYADDSHYFFSVPACSRWVVLKVTGFRAFVRSLFHLGAVAPARGAA